MRNEKFISISLILFLYVLHLNNSVYAFVPAARFGHTAALINNNIYFQGGAAAKENILSDLFYLDVSKSFDITDISLMPWTDLSFIKGSSFRLIGTSCGIKNSSIFFIGGATNIFVSKFDTLTQQWSVPNISGVVSTDRTGIQCV